MMTGPIPLVSGRALDAAVSELITRGQEGGRSSDDAEDRCPCAKRVFPSHRAVQCSAAQRGAKNSFKFPKRREHGTWNLGRGQAVCQGKRADASPVRRAQRGHD